MSERLRERFRQGKAEGRPLFVAYVTAGYPSPADTVPVLLALEAGGADIIEIGVPFTDPLADGATIQAANQVALAQGASFAQCLEFVHAARREGLEAPVLLMGYYNPILAYGEAAAARDGARLGVDGFIVVALPPDDASVFISNIPGGEGIALGQVEGKATITATWSDGTKGQTVLNVTAATLTSLAVTPAMASIAKGTYQVFSAIGTFTDNSNKASRTGSASKIRSFS